MNDTIHQWFGCESDVPPPPPLPYPKLGPLVLDLSKLVVSPPPLAGVVLRLFPLAAELVESVRRSPFTAPLLTGVPA